MSLKLPNLDPKLRQRIERQMAQEDACKTAKQHNAPLVGEGWGEVEKISERVFNAKFVPTWGGDAAIKTEIIIPGVQKFTVLHDPTPAPRQTRADVWKKRPCVLRYRKFCDAVRVACGQQPCPPRVELLFNIAMPDSWPKRKRQIMLGKPHRQRPDVDNLSKATIDALFNEDGGVAYLVAEKRWALRGSVEINLFHGPEK